MAKKTSKPVNIQNENLTGRKMKYFGRLKMTLGDPFNYNKIVIKSLSVAI